MIRLRRYIASCSGDLLAESGECGPAELQSAAPAGQVCSAAGETRLGRADSVWSLVTRHPATRQHADHNNTATQERDGAYGEQGEQPADRSVIIGWPLMPLTSVLLLMSKSYIETNVYFLIFLSTIFNGCSGWPVRIVCQSWFNC